ncbi:exodeoxyribonuclease V subunit beta [Endozoicomonas sp. OPT23]|uniref:exodeoxyribonuclease V subunit beta n=1 Tax=Endozoicomonas sp. OPT23 TaxID=2072845 RepID=UPI00129A9BFA|nr:exodeoxyribonuclease V subunit beta [Endozoicomonas sp. OPT23]MRI34889.1 exodeoxyribonuclease V subunit beta [Endozoicomonas sp. OPT23]
MTKEVTVHKLDAKTIPLSGNRLIEASAGTGKTYTIANLYLRLVVGHKVLSPLTVDQILVVTFTEAATEELRDRIRKRLQVARKAYEGEATDDDFIQFLLNSLDRHAERAQLLLAAERQMDEATVFTIHGFCQRMLKQHAFESGTLFSSELITDEHQLLQQTTADFWRRHFYSLDKPLARLTRKLWKTPDALLSSIRSYLGKHDLTVYTGQLPKDMEAFQKRCIEPSLNLKALWKEEQEQIEEQLQEAGLKKTAKPLKRLPLMAQFAHGDELFPNLGRNESWDIYSTASLKKALSKSGKMPDHPVFQKIDELLNSGLSIADAFEGMIINSALKEVSVNHHQNLADKHQMSFDDLLGNMRAALYGPTGDALAQAVRKQFSVAMIDEFQDTDPQQYAIFSRIYPAESDNSSDHKNTESNSGLFMIGDPKQAIYAFRGADIFTYMQAREQVTAHYSLDTNWRSTSAMVNGVNRLFSVSDNPFIYQEIPFESVHPSPVADQKKLLNSGQTVPAIQLWLQESDGKAIGKADYEQTMTQATAREINRLLTQAKSEQVCIEKKGKQEALRAGDIAVLVRTGRQGQMIRDALADQGVASVYLSSSDSVFACQEAQDILRLMDACLTPNNDRVLRSALATPVLNMTAQELDNLNQDEQAWEGYVDEFLGYQKIWQHQGPLPMLRTLLRQRRIAEKLLSTTYGERRLTDFLHIGELLASASLKLESPHALRRWLSEHIHSPDSGADDQQLHLESERNLVQIVTIHKSKGLEYPIVFLPYICSFRENKDPLYHQDNRTVLDLTGNEQSFLQAEKERLAEDLRLLYVALTRSVHSCYLGLAPLKAGPGKKGEKTDLHKSAIGYLLGNGGEVTCASLKDSLTTLAEEPSLVTLQPLPVEPSALYEPPVEKSLELAARTFQHQIEKNWWVTSYSALSKTSHSKPSQTTLDASTELSNQELAEQEQLANSDNADEIEETLDIFHFPKGARPGTFMHTLFEEYPHDSNQPDVISQFVQEQLEKEGFEEKWSDTLTGMLEHCLETPLDGDQLKLGQLSAQQQKAEMEFYLPVSRLNANELNTLLTSEDPLSAKAGALDFRTVQGMLKGFIDLTFEYQGRWYVLDYKSNWLGKQVDDYLRPQMEQVMIEHRYDLQYQIYSLALHRLLKIRLPDYDFEQHFGGVFYLFLRGVRNDRDDQPGIFQHRPSLQLINKLDSLFAGEPSC